MHINQRVSKKNLFVSIAVVFLCDEKDGLSMANENSINNCFSVDQIKELSTYVIDVYGTDLPLEKLNESIYLVMENIPGIELISLQEIQLLISQIRNQYHEQRKHQKEGKRDQS